jgi:uncharacterized membrane protein
VNERTLRVAIAVVALLGLAIAGYLTYVHYAGIKPLCVSGSGGCERVQSSHQAQLAGVPVAVLGLVGYAVILVSAALPGDVGRVPGGLVAISGFAFSVYLTYEELFVIHAVCQWCVASAVLMAGLAALTSLRVMSPAPALVRS